jgi:signal transduction histidine kinase
MAVMVAWSVLTILGYERPRLRAWPLLLADVGVTAACVLLAGAAVGRDLLSAGIPSLTAIWFACPVLAVAVVKGIGWGMAAAVLVGACDLAAHGMVTQASVSGPIILVMAAAALGYLGNIATRAQEQLRQAAAAEAAHSERDRLARTIHDSVLQVLALVKRRGEEIGGAATDLGRLAGEQEVALRLLVGPGASMSPVGLTDLRELIVSLTSDRVVTSAPAGAVWLPARMAEELLAAVTAATENVHQHCPSGTRTWILLEEEPDTVTLTVRDDGPGIAPGRLDEAAAQGRLGITQSIRGRIADLGGQVAITTAPGEGTEVELSIPRPRSRAGDVGRHGAQAV